MILLTAGQTFIMPWEEGGEIVDLTCLCLTLLRFLTPLPARESDLRLIPDRDREEQGSKSRLSFRVSARGRVSITKQGGAREKANL